MGVQHGPEEGGARPRMTSDEDKGMGQTVVLPALGEGGDSYHRNITEILDIKLQFFPFRDSLSSRSWTVSAVLILDMR